MFIAPPRPLIEELVSALPHVEDVFSDPACSGLLENIDRLHPGFRQHLETLTRSAQWLLAIGSSTPKNSSVPPSRAPLGSEDQTNDKKPRNAKEEKKQERKPGGQPGHKGSTLEQTDHPDQIVEVRPDNLPPGEYIFKTVKRRQLVELIFLVPIVEYLFQQAIDRRTGRVFPAPEVPAHLTRPIQYAPTFKAFVLYQSVWQMIPYKRTVKVFEACDIHLSQGSLANFLCEADEMLIALGVDKFIADSLLREPVLNTDETYVSLGKQRAFIHTLASKNYCWYHFSTHRGHQAHDELGLHHQYKGVLVHDNLSAYDRYQCEHALCHAHVIRELNKILETTPFTWAKFFIDFFSRYEKIHKKEGRLDAQSFAKAVTVFKALLTRARNQMDDGVPAEKMDAWRKRYSKAYSLLDRFERYMSWWLFWLTREDVPYTNNWAENVLRMIKVHEKVSNCFRNEKYAQIWCRLRSFLKTCQLHGVTNLMQALKDLLMGKLPEFMQTGVTPAAETGADQTDTQSAPSTAAAETGADQTDTQSAPSMAAAETGADQADTQSAPPTAAAESSLALTPDHEAGCLSGLRAPKVRDFLGVPP